MDYFTFMVAWMVATTIMSGFSSLWSDAVGDNFREHDLLSHIFTKGTLPTFTINQWLIGWAIHFVFGAFFLGGYEVLWQVTGLMRSIIWSLIFGLIIGVLGVIGWVVMFKFRKDRPNINYPHFYLHLIIAHLVFSASAYAVYAFINP